MCSSTRSGGRWDPQRRPSGTRHPHQQAGQAGAAGSRFYGATNSASPREQAKKKTNTFTGSVRNAPLSLHLGMLKIYKEEPDRYSSELVNNRSIISVIWPAAPRPRPDAGQGAGCGYGADR